MEHYLYQKSELKNREKKSPLGPSINPKNFNTQKNKQPKLPKSKFPKFTVSNDTCDSNINFLYLFNNNINAKHYFEEKRKEKEQKKNQNLKTNNQEPKNLNLNTLKSNINDDDKDNNSSFSFDFSTSEDEETKKEREEIIKKITKKTPDTITFVEFDIFDRSKMIEIPEKIEKNEKMTKIPKEPHKEITYIPPVKKIINKIKTKTENKIENFSRVDSDERSSTRFTDGTDSKIELIKKAENKNKINKERMNNFRKKYDNDKHINHISNKSRSIKKGFERSRSKDSA